MDQRDEFSKWMSAVEEALSNEGKELAEDVPAVNECGCGSWDCATCFPAQDEMPGMNGALDGMGGHNPDSAIVIGGVDVAEPGEEDICPTCGHDHAEHEHGDEFAAPPLGRAPHRQPETCGHRDRNRAHHCSRTHQAGRFVLPGAVAGSGDGPHRATGGHHGGERGFVLGPRAGVGRARICENASAHR